MEILLTRFHWLQLTNEQRSLMREVFNIPKSGGVEMQDNKMLSDGSNENDLRAVNIETMQNFLENPEEKDFSKLYEQTLAKVDEMLEQKEADLTAQSRSEEAKRRNSDVSHIVDSVLETIKNLPMDAQIQIKKALSSTVTKEEQHEEPKITKKAEKGSNK